jgi:hypothetical protein
MHPDGGAAGKSTGSAGSAATGEGTGTAGSSAGGAAASGFAGASGFGGTGILGVAGSGVAGSGVAGTGVTGQGGAGAQAGGSGQGGAGGAPACGPCPAPNCKDGFMQVVDPAISCCPICRPLNCATVDCANPNCPSGTHAEVPNGQCCPVCVMGVSQACNQAQAAYDRDRAILLDKYGSSQCMVDADCVLVAEANACEQHCDVALPVSTANFYVENFLKPDGAKCDASCPPIFLPACQPFVAVCSNGLCTALPKAR